MDQHATAAVRCENTGSIHQQNEADETKFVDRNQFELHFIRIYIDTYQF